MMPLTSMNVFETAPFLLVLVVLALYQLCVRWSPPGTNQGHTQTVYRSSRDPGLWCSLLFPLSVVLSQSYTDTDETLALLLMTVSVASYIFEGDQLKWIPAVLLLCLLVQLLWLLSSALSVVVVLSCGLFLLLLRWLPSRFPKCFTFGEGAIVTQLLAFMSYRVVIAALWEQKRPVDTMAGVVYTSVCVATVLYVIGSRVTGHQAVFYLAYLVTAGVVSLPAVLYLLGQEALFEIVHLMFGQFSSVLLLLWWIVCTAVSVYIVSFHGNHNSETTKSKTRSGSTVLRKFFHLTVIAVFVPGLLLQPDFLYLASVVAIGVLVIVETVRLNSISPLGAVIDQYYQVYLDQQDSGDLILTPVYLLIGCSFPVWLSGHVDASAGLQSYAGVISLGVGDMAASVVGSRVGKWQWPGRKKTIEGTASAVVAQLITIYGLASLGVPGAAISMATVVAVVLVSILEAVTTQIDNLILPVAMYILLAGT